MGCPERVTAWENAEKLHAQLRAAIADKGAKRLWVVVSERTRRISVHVAVVGDGKTPFAARSRRIRWAASGSSPESAAYFAGSDWLLLDHVGNTRFGDDVEAS